MTPRVLVRVLWSVAIGLAIVSAWLSWVSMQSPPPVASVDWAAPRFASPIPPETLADAAALVIRGDPFRLDRSPALVPYSYEIGGGPPSPPRPEPPKPVLVVSGIVGGPPWEALLDGVPGRSGSLVVHAGDTVGGLRVRSISETMVTITGLDTTWMLPLKRAWP